MLEPGLGTPDPFVSMPAPSAKGRLFGGLFFFLALLCAGFSLYNSTHAAGLVGRHGTLTVERCWIDHGSRHHSDKTVCAGTFRADDGTTVDHEATVTADRERGDRIPVQQTVSGYLATGFGEIWRWCALFFLGWIVAALGIPFAATGIMPSRGQAVAVGRLIAGTRASAWMKRLVLGGAGGAALSLYLAWIF
ncbi:hypothetical protein ACIQU1_15920 [Streptomyces angustmyceticus]|uniref:hypothetical protein n=1 Tax=Streptomyces angustmyceticus TaxID=285578 RepID=UPI00344B9F82